MKNSNRECAYFFAVQDGGFFLHGQRSRGVILGSLQRELISADGYGDEYFLLRRTHAADEVHQAVGVQHVEQAHQSRWMEGPISLVVVPQVVRRYRE